MFQKQLDDRIIFYPSGKVLGGASSRNYMWFPRSVLAYSPGIFGVQLPHSNGHG